MIRALRQRASAGNGPICRQVEASLSRLLGARHVLLMSSCTAAIEAALAVLGVRGREVILPSFAFPSLAAAIVRTGARPVFADIDPEHLCLDPERVERALSPRTGAILYVDYGGFPGSVEAVQQLASRRRIPLIEDAAHALGSRLRERALGTWGTVGCLSFHETKVATCGEGGAFLADDEALARAASIYREYGTNRSAFFQGEVDHYEWIAEGSSALLAEPLAGLLQAQLDRLDEGLGRRRAIAQRYHEALAPLAEAEILRLPVEASGAKANWQAFYTVTRGQETARRFIEALARRGIEAHRHFFPLHQSVYALRAGYASKPLPVTEWVAPRLVRLPIHPTLTQAQQARVVQTVLDFFSLEQHGRARHARNGSSA